MKVFRLTFLFISISLLFGSCQETVHGNGVLVSEKRLMNDFETVMISGMYDIVLAEGEPAVVIETDENLVPYIETNVSGDRLEIKTKDVTLSSKKLVLTIFYDHLKELKISGAAQISTRETLHADEFRLLISGAGSGTLDVDVSDLLVDISGGAEINLTGRADEADYDVKGAGEVNAFDLKTKDAIVDVAGAGELNLFVEEDLDVEISGAAEVNYKGSPKIKQSVSGAGSINNVD